MGWVRGAALKGLHGDPTAVSLALLNGTSIVQVASAGKAWCRSKYTHPAKAQLPPGGAPPREKARPDRRLQGGLTGSERRQGPGQHCRHRAQSGSSGAGRPATVTARKLSGKRAELNSAARAPAPGTSPGITGGEALTASGKAWGQRPRQQHPFPGRAQPGRGGAGASRRAWPWGRRTANLSS